jgi:hypothetical protein
MEVVYIRTENRRPLCRSAIWPGYHGTSPRCCRVFSVVNSVPRNLAVALTALSLWLLPGGAAAQAPQRSVLRQLVGDLAMEARTRGDGSMTLGAADSRTSVVVTFMATDLRRWSDSATRMLAAKPRRGSIIKWEASVSGPGIAAGSMSLARTITATDTTIVLLVTDTSFRAVRTPLSAEDAKALAAAMKRAANASLPTRAAPLPKSTTPPKAATPPPKKPPVPDLR